MQNKVLLLFPQYSSGGAEKAFEAYVKNLQNFTVIPFLLKSKHSSARSLRFPLTCIFYLRYTIKVAYCYLIEKPELVISFKSHLVNVLILKVLNSIWSCKIIFRESNDVIGYSQYELGSFSKVLFRIFLKKIPATIADQVIVNSKGSAESFHRLTKIDKKKIRTIYNPFIFEKPNHRHPSKDVDLCFVGRLEAQKNPMLFLNLSHLLLLVHPSFTIRIVGSGRLFENLESEIDRRKLGSCIILQSYSPEKVADCFASSKFSLLTSFYEGMPNVILESLQYECIPFSFDIRSGPAEIMTERFLVEPYNVCSFLKKFNRQYLNYKTVFEDFDFQSSQKLFSNEAFKKSLITL